MDKEGKVYGVNSAKHLYVRDGVSSIHPTGTTWRFIPSSPFVHISAGYSKTFALDSYDSIYAFSGKFKTYDCSICFDLDILRSSLSLKEVKHFCLA